jgi:uncharacterized protein
VSADLPGDGEQESLIEFPCDFPIKVMGRAENGLDSVVRTLIDQELGAGRLLESRCVASGGGRFVSVTVTVRVEDKSELDGFYAALTAHQQVLMVL